MHAMNTASLSDILPLSIFRAYDIRGIVDETLTEPGVFLIGKALGTLVLEQNETAITIARDGRFSGARLAQALSDGILSTGCNVIDIGMVPTPILYYATHLLPHHSGIMITGSHNPPEYNGLKIVINGVSLADLALQKLHQRIVDQQFVQGHGKLETLDIAESYLDNVTQRIQVTRPLRIVLDAGNGVAGLIAPTLFRRLGCDVDELYCDVDGNFPNHHPDPSQSKNLSDLVRVVAEKNADIGLAFDGDGDRLGVVTNLGEIICPDRLLMLFAEGILADEPQAKIIYDVKCTHHLDAHIRTLGGEPLMWKTGHSFIKAKLNETQALLAGEMSGHFFFKHRWFGFDDALYAGARLAEIIAAQEQTSDSVFARLPKSINTDELKISVTEEEKFILMQQLIDQADFKDAKDVMTIDGLRVNFENGWGLVRPSNTTPYLILRFEAINQIMLERIQFAFRKWLLSVNPEFVLPF